jgi:hypothetical protein
VVAIQLLVILQEQQYGASSSQADMGDATTAVGHNSLSSNTGTLNTAIGKNAGSSVTSGAKNTYIGSFNGAGYTTSSNQIFLSDGDGNIGVHVDSNQLVTCSGGIDAPINLNAQTGTTYTTVLSDSSKTVTLSNAAAITCTIPPNSSVAYPVGTLISFAQTGAGQVTLAAGAGVTLNTEVGLKITAQYGFAAALKTATDTWLVSGSLEA